MQRLIDAGATIVGKASLPEFAWSVTGQNPWYGTVRNPRHPGRTTGGSSSANAAALAAGLCDLALGTDTGCSIRLPSACCGTVGLKPRWGAVSTDGVFPLTAGYQCAALCSCTDLKQPANYHWPTDTAENVDYGTLAEAIRLTEAVVRRLDERWL